MNQKTSEINQEIEDIRKARIDVDKVASCHANEMKKAEAKFLQWRKKNCSENKVAIKDKELTCGNLTKNTTDFVDPSACKQTKDDCHDTQTSCYDKAKQLNIDCLDSCNTTTQ